MNTAELKQFCTEVRRDIVNMTANAGSGHPGGSLSVCEILATLYFTQMNVDPKDPHKADRDRLVLCSDGAFGYMGVSDFRSLLTSGLTAEEMMNECYERGSTDNITILALDRMRDARAGP